MCNTRTDKNWLFLVALGLKIKDSKSINWHTLKIPIFKNENSADAADPLCTTNRWN